MKVRVDNIIYQLAGSDDPLTADELGKKLAVSSRTIKSEMAEVRSELKKVGAELQAKRNEGYSLVGILPPPSSRWSDGGPLSHTFLRNV